MKGLGLHSEPPKPNPSHPGHHPTAWGSHLPLGHEPKPALPVLPLPQPEQGGWGHTHSGTAGIQPPLPGSVLTPFCPQFRNFKIIYRRYAGLYFCICVDVNDNNLAYLEAIHNFVEVSQSRAGLGDPRVLGWPLGLSSASRCVHGSVLPLSTLSSSPLSSTAANFSPLCPSATNFAFDMSLAVSECACTCVWRSEDDVWEAVLQPAPGRGHQACSRCLHWLSPPAGPLSDVTVEVFHCLVCHPIFLSSLLLSLSVCSL